jgi:glycosyltransferase involved in cell wall biosynthesis
LGAEVLFEACRRAAAAPIYDVRSLDEPLVEATPLTARRVLHWGPGGRAFAGAVLSWNPTGAVEVLGEAPDAAPEPGEDFAAVVLGAPPPPGLLARLAGRLAPGGHLIARWSSAQAVGPEIAAALAAEGLALREPVDAAGAGVLRAQKTPPGGRAQPALRLETIAMAPYLMDVRSRLPARGLRTDPELVVRYATSPANPTAQPVDAPKVLVRQRPGPAGAAHDLRVMAYAITRGWVLVVEYDDHPQLVAQTLRRAYDEAAELHRFACAHAVQTTTEPLRELFLRANPEVRVFPNAVFELAPFPARDLPRRVFYGAVGRGGFSLAVARALAPAVARLPDVEFVVLGDREVFAALPTANKLFREHLPYEAYLAEMASCAVSLSPLEPAPMRETKSDAKFLDAARAGVLTIASPTVYDQTIRHGENGLLARTLDDWAPLLIEALEDAPRRRAMARAAWDEVRQGRMFAAQIPERRDWCFSLWARREELDAQALARVPGLADAVAAERARLAARADKC